MATRILVLGMTAGQGATTTAVGLAVDAAAAQPTLLIDADPALGSVADLLALPAGDSRSITGAFSPGGIPWRALKQQMVMHSSRLGVVPGWASPGPPPHEVVRALAPSLAQTAADVVVVDLGSPFATPGMTAAGRNAVVDAIAPAFDHVFIVVRIDASTLHRSLRILQTVPRVPRGRLVISRPSNRHGIDEFVSLAQRLVPDYPVSTREENNLEIDWDPARIQRAGESGRPFALAGFAQATGVVGMGEVVPMRQTRPMLPWKRRSA